MSNVTVTVTAPACGTLTNVASVSTPTGDPNPTNNLSAPVVTTVTNSTLLQADVAVFKTGQPAALPDQTYLYRDCDQ